MTDQSLYQGAVDQSADAFGIPRNIFNSLVQTESSWNANASSSAGAVGLTQLLPSTAAELGVDAYDPVSNIAGGAKYLAQQFSKFGNWNDALAAYNAGPGNIAAGQDYASKVLSGAGVTAGAAASDLPAWAQSALTAAGLPTVSITNIILYVLAILVLLLVGYFAIKSLFNIPAVVVKSA